MKLYDFPLHKHPSQNDREAGRVTKSDIPLFYLNTDLIILLQRCCLIGYAACRKVDR